VTRQPPAPRPTTYWFFDTVSLLTMTLDPGFEVIVAREVTRTNGQRLLLDVVEQELKNKVGDPSTKAMALAALTATDTPAWTSMKTTSVDVNKIREVQVEVNDGRPVPLGSTKHWAESVMITMFRHLATRPAAVNVVLLSDDYDARRVADLIGNVRPCHLAALMYAQYLQGSLTDTELLRLADVAHVAGRGPHIIASDLTRGWRGLGMAGRPPFL
jgi:hypothetical protein